MSDFENDGYDDELADAFDSLPNTNQEKKAEFLRLSSDNNNDEVKLDKQIQEETTEKKQENTGKIKIDISSVEKLTGALRFAAANLERSVEKVDNVKKLSEVLNLLQSIDQNKYHDFFEKFEDKINLSKIDQKIETKINFILNKKVKQIDDIFAQSAGKYQQYAEVFETPEIFDFFEEVKNLEKFRKKFKFKSILATSIITAAITLIVSYMGFSQLYNYKLNALISKNEKIMSVMKYAKNVHIEQNNKVRQLQFNNSKMHLMLLNNGTMVVQVDKK